MSVKYFVFDKGNILLCKNKHEYFELPTSDDLSLMPQTEALEIGDYNNFLCLAINISSIKTPSNVNTAIWVSLKECFELLEGSWFPIVVRANQMLRWDEQHKFCSQCGKFLLKKEGVFEKRCAACHLSFFPKISPSVIVMIKKQNKILMARSSHFPSGSYALIAGFVEPGETLEQAVHREVDEEVGIKIKNLCYFGSQPWPFPDSLMVGFTADYHSGDLSFNDGEIEEAGWYGKNNLPGNPSSSISIASRLIDSFVEEN